MIQLRLFLAVSALILLKPLVYGQQKDSLDNQYKWAARLNPMALLDPFDLHLNVGAEHRYHPSWSVAAEVSTYLVSGYYNSVKKTRGYMFRPSLRFYPRPSGKMYFDAELFYKKVNYSFTDWLGKAARNGVPAYEEYTDFTLQKSVMGGHLKIGRQSYLISDKRWRAELFVGLGVRNKKERIREDPHAVYTPGNLFFFDPDFDPSLQLSGTMGFRIVRMFY